jgi:cystine transport system substrate-binding protein
MKLRLLASAAAAVVAVTLAGCSASGSTSGSAGSAKASSSATGALAAVQKSGVLRIGTEGTYRPFSYHEGGSGPITGFDVDVAKAVAAKLGVKAQFEETQWDAIFAGLEAHRFDVIANQVSVTPERKAKYLFSAPYTVSKGVVVTKSTDSAITSFASLKGRTTAQSLTSNWYQLAQQDGAKVQSVEGWAQAVALVKQGRVDATINDQLTYLDYKKQTGAAGLKVAATTTDSSQSALTFAKGSSTLVTAANKALASLRADGTLARLSQKYFGADVTK